ncbi:MAG: 1-(5-phosphoribosyl)-5-[(5-phosphoribosylamino)methylideneamino]imidazole-4-carboxamide isomerase [Planctomycetes bacterium]|nr:1-(5-phosphoribosyl)-5-[(5-phosphoribosylamino)methylideneamino]imidazole-4-carboxamide isomerase [Planctomycetota bacterium]
MYLFPAIDLRAGQVVRLHQGDYGKQKTYGHDPLEQARLFERAGATWLHVVDLDGARSGVMTQLDAIRSICTNTKLKVEVGGGVRSQETIDLLLSAGVTRVILGTAALEKWDWFADLVQRPAYHQKIVLGLDAKQGKLAVSGWERQTSATPIEVAKKVSDWPLGAIVYTDISTDGTMQGPNVPATKAMAEATRVPVIASGGVGTLEHLRALRALPIQGAIVGRAIYEGAFTVEEGIREIEGGR